MSLYLRLSSKQYEYARRVAAGEESCHVIKQMGINKNTAKDWRYQLRRLVRKEAGINVAYPVAVVLVMLQDAEREAVIATFRTQYTGDLGGNGCI